MDLRKHVDTAIKYIWHQLIPTEYAARSLLLEDSLKCAMYHHLRNCLSDPWLDAHEIRIFPEYFVKEPEGARADLAVVRIQHGARDTHLREQVAEVLALFEIKYKGVASPVSDFTADIQQLLSYRAGHPEAHLYACFVQERTAPDRIMEAFSTGRPSDDRFTGLIAWKQGDWEIKTAEWPTTM